MASRPIATLRALLARVMGKPLVTDFWDSFFASNAEVLAGAVTDKAVPPSALAAGVGTSQLAAGALAASVAGRAKMATGFFDEATVDDKFALGAIDADRLKNLSITDAQIKGTAAITVSKLNGVMHESGTCEYGILRIAANVADVETVTIGGEVYEFDRAADGVVPGNIAVTGHADDTPANATDALILAINGNALGSYYATDIDANTVLVTTREAGAGGTAVAETMAGVGNAWDAAAFAGGRDLGNRRMVAGARVPLAAEVTAGFLAIPCLFNPTVVMIQVVVTAARALKAWDGVYTIVPAAGSEPAYVLLNNAGATDWAATDTINFVFVG